MYQITSDVPPKVGASFFRSDFFFSCVLCTHLFSSSALTLAPSHSSLLSCNPLAEYTASLPSQDSLQTKSIGKCRKLSPNANATAVRHYQIFKFNSLHKSGKWRPSMLCAFFTSFSASNRICVHTPYCFHLDCTRRPVQCCCCCREGNGKYHSAGVSYPVQLATETLSRTGSSIGPRICCLVASLAV